MNSMQPDQGFGTAGDQGAPPGQSGYLGGQQRLVPKRTRAQLIVHIVRGVLYGVLALGIAAGGFGEITVGAIGGAVLCFVIAVPLACYDVLIWFPALRRRRRR